MDDYHHRFELHENGRDDIEFTGREVPDPATATAMGRFAYSPMSWEPKVAARMVATVLGPVGRPAKRRMAGLTTMM